MKLNFGFILICSLLMFTPLARGSVYLWTRTLIQIGAVFGMFYLLLQMTLAPKKKPVNPLVLPLVAVTMLVLVSAYLSDYPDICVEGGLMFLSYMALYFCARAAIQTRQQERVLLMLIAGTAGFISIISFFKATGGALPLWTYTDLKPTDYFTGTYGNHNHFAGILEMAIPALLGLVLVRSWSGTMLFFMAGLTLFFLFTLTLTFSRGGWISTIAGLTFMAAVLVTRSFPGKKYRALVFLPLIFLLIISLANVPVFEKMVTLVQGTPGDEFRFRLKVWEKGIDMVKDRPLAGTGPGTFARAFVPYSPPGFDVLPMYAHNDYLQFTIETGVLFLLFCPWLIYAFFKAGFSKMKTPSRQARGITLGAMAGVFSILVHSLFDFNLHIPANALIFTLLAALATSPVKSGSRHHEG